MSLLSVCQSILYETKNSTIPTTIIGNTENTALQILQAVSVAAVEISRSYSWQKLQKEYSFSSVASTSGYDLPSDFDRMIDGTFWNSTNRLVISGITTPQQWQTLKNSSAFGGSSCEFYRVRNGQVLIYPTPTSTKSYVFEYISKNCIQGADTTLKSSFTADTDTFLIDEHILRLDATWRFLNNQGRPYGEEQRVANLAIADRAKIDGGRATIYANTQKAIIDAKISLPYQIIPV